MNNGLHDWWYDHGFDEQAGNAQTSNYGRGGVEGDAISAQGQDSSGRNNANMATPADGGSPTMQMYLFDGPVRSEEHTSELQSLMRISYAVFCLKKKTIYTNKHN